MRRRAADLAVRLAGEARRSATVAQERALLRLLGIDGLDRSGRPLAVSTVERYCGSEPRRLAEGVLLPLAAATLESSLGPREVALEVAAGLIDLGHVADALAEPERLAEARAQAARLVGEALARVDDNRTAVREQRSVLGSAPEPWFGLGLLAADAGPAVREIRQLVAGGVDVIAVAVPASWEFAEARRNAPADDTLAPATRGRSVRARLNRAPLPRRLALPQLDHGSVPAGSQRGLAELRRAADDAAARRGRYASLMTVASAFSAPEQAVVAAFERIDMVAADPIREIVEDNLDPERALADHAFAHRLQSRAGCQVVMGAGPLTLGAEVAGGIPSDTPTRAGRALALQALGVQLALAGGVPPESLLLGCVPGWMSPAADPSAHLVQAWLRRLLFPEQKLVVEAPAALAPGSSSVDRAWTPALVAALSGAPAALVVGCRTGTAPADAAAEVAAASAAGSALRRSLGDGALKGDSLEMARATLVAAERTLERLAADGWSSVLGPAGVGAADGRFGHGAVVARSKGPASGAGVLDHFV